MAQVRQVKSLELNTENQIIHSNIYIMKSENAARNSVDQIEAKILTVLEQFMPLDVAEGVLELINDTLVESEDVLRFLESNDVV